MSEEVNKASAGGGKLQKCSACYGKDPECKRCGGCGYERARKSTDRVDVKK